MGDIKSQDASLEDPEKAVELSPNITYGDGEVRDVMFKHADPNDGDEALKAFVGHEGETFVMTPEMEKNLLRKIDLNLMPVSLPFQQHRQSTNGLTPRSSVSCTASTTSTKLLYRMLVSWDYKRSSISRAQTTNG